MLTIVSFLYIAHYILLFHLPVLLFYISALLTLWVDHPDQHLEEEDPHLTDPYPTEDDLLYAEQLGEDPNLF